MDELMVSELQDLVDRDGLVDRDDHHDSGSDTVHYDEAHNQLRLEFPELEFDTEDYTAYFDAGVDVLPENVLAEKPTKSDVELARLRRYGWERTENTKNENTKMDSRKRKYQYIGPHGVVETSMKRALHHIRICLRSLIRRKTRR